MPADQLSPSEPIWNSLLIVVYLRGSYLNGKQHGEWTRYFSEGDNMKLTYDNGVVKGKAVGGIARF